MRPNQEVRFHSTYISQGGKVRVKKPVFLCSTDNQVPKALKDGCLAYKMASEIAGAGGNRECEGPARSLREALVSSDRSFPPVGPGSDQGCGGGQNRIRPGGQSLDGESGVAEQ